MKEKLAAAISDILKSRDRLWNETSIKTSVVLRILHVLGWDPFDINQVEPEHPVGSTRIDFALRADGNNKAFIEVKRQTEELERHEEQLLGYAFKSGVPLAILTNGFTWRYYLPLRQGPWKDRLFYEADFLRQDPAAIAQVLTGLLARENIISGEAYQLAEQLSCEPLPPPSLMPDNTVPGGTGEDPLEILNRRFGLKIKAVRKYPFDPDPEFELDTDRGKISLGKIENIMRFKLFQRKIAASVGVVINRISSPEWEQCAQAILHAAMTVENMPTNATDIGTVKEWFAKYISAYRKPAATIEECATRGSYYIRKTGSYFISRDKFVEWLRMNGEKSTDRVIMRKIKRAGTKTKRTTYSYGRPPARANVEGFVLNEKQRNACVRDTRFRKGDLADEADQESSEDIRTGEYDGDAL